MDQISSFFFQKWIPCPNESGLRFNFFLKGIIFSDTVNSATPLSLKACYFNLKIYHQPKTNLIKLGYLIHITVIKLVHNLYVNLLGNKVMQQHNLSNTDSSTKVRPRGNEENYHLKEVYTWKPIYQTKYI